MARTETRKQKQERLKQERLERERQEELEKQNIDESLDGEDNTNENTQTPTETIPNSENIDVSSEPTKDETPKPSKLFDKYQVDKYIDTFKEAIKSSGGDLNNEKGVASAFAFIYTINAIISKMDEPTNEVKHLIKRVGEIDEFNINTVGSCHAKWTNTADSLNAYIGLFSVLFAIRDNLKMTEYGVKIQFKHEYTKLGEVLSNFVPKKKFNF